MISRAERERRERQSERDRVMRMREMEERSGLSRWTIKRAADKGEITLVKLTTNSVGARESEFWRWVDSKQMKVA